MTRRLPTTDLYFRHACRDFVGGWVRRGPITRLGENCYAAGETLLLIRQDDERLMRQALAWRGRVVYLIDDDIKGAAFSPGLPDHYRRRLQAFDLAFHQPMLQRADLLVVPCEHLARSFAADPLISASIERIEPFWNLPFGDLSHFDRLANGELIQLVHLGSASHSRALKKLAPLIADLLDNERSVHFTYIGREAPHPALASHPRVKRIPPMAWPRYRRWLSSQHFHLALYPLDDSPFDRARSSNKLFEHGIIGAAGIYAEHWGPAKALEGVLLAPSDPSNWYAIMQEAVTHPSRLAGLAASSARALSKGGNMANQRRLWRKIFRLESAA